MIIENPDSLKNWLTKYLEPLCDADPQALSKYIMALIKKDKTEKELRTICFDQLEVFLSKETAKFVDVLFQALSSKSYLNSPSNITPITTLTTQVASNNALVNKLDDKLIAPNVSTLVSNEVIKTSNVNINAASRVSAQNMPSENVNNDREHFNHNSPIDHQSTVNSSTISNVNRMPSPSQAKKTQHLRRSKTRSRSRSRSKSPYSSHQRHSRSGKAPNNFHVDSRNYDDRARKRLPINRNTSQQRGTNRRYAPSTSRGNAFKRGSNMRNINRNHSRSRSRSRSSLSSRSSRSRSRSRNRSLSRDRTNSIKKPKTTKSPSPPREKDSAKKRCRDYDEQGFCIRGELCPFDHGKDPLVLDSNASQIVLNQFSNAPLLPTPNVATSNPFVAEPYNPEAPAIDLTNNQQMRNQLNYQPGAAIPPPHFWQVGRMAPNLAQNPSNPIHSQISQQQQPPQMLQQRPRELIHLPSVGDKSLCPQDLNNRVDLASNVNNNNNNNIGIGLNSNINEINQRSMINNRGGISRRGNRGGHRGGYKNNHKRHMANTENADKCTLEVRKIPSSLNTITNLNEHFSKFGQIVNLQVCYDNDSEAALIQFASHNEALSAYRCTEAVLNNRFIKVFWHSKEQQQQTQEQTDTKTKLEENEDSKNSTNENQRISAKERLGIKINEGTEKITTAISSSGTISRTVFNPALLKKLYQPSTQLTTTTVNKPQIIPPKTKEEQKKEKLQRKIDLHKKKQELLKVYVTEQRNLIEKLEKAKIDEEKTNLRVTLIALTDKVRLLEDELKKEGQEILTETTSKINSVKSRSQLEKELLDAEMDYYNKMHKGEFTVELQKRLYELRSQAKEAGIKSKSQKILRKLQKSRNIYKNSFDNVRKVDKRTRKILIPGIKEEDQIDLVSHIAQFAVVENVEHSNGGAIVTFKTRRDAETAVSQIGTIKFKDHFSLKGTWFDEAKLKTLQQKLSEGNENLKSISDIEMKTVEKEDLIDKDEDDLLGVEMDDDILEEEETDDENESRSWRR